MHSWNRAALAQTVLKGVLNTPEHGITNTIKIRILAACRGLLIRTGDPLIRYRLNGTEILLPLSHNLPVHRRSFPEYSSNIARIARHVESKYADLTFIDVGANVGDTVAILRSTGHFPILCIEGDDTFFHVLQQNVAQFQGDVYLEHAFVAEATGTFKGWVNAQGGTAHLVEDESRREAIHAKALSDILKAHPRFAQSKMIKVDTDGFDCRILRSELALLCRLKPVIFFEYDPYFFGQCKDDGFTVFESLQSIGYETAIFYENTGEYLLTSKLENKLLIEDIHEFYSGRRGQRYCDICVFHADDSDLCEVVRLSEIEFFNRLRCSV